MPDAKRPPNICNFKIVAKGLLNNSKNKKLHTFIRKSIYVYECLKVNALEKSFK